MMHLSSAKLLLLVLALAGLSLPMHAQTTTAEDSGKKKPVAGEQKKGAAAEEAEKPADQGLQLGKLLPLNKPNLRVKIPGFEKGQLASMVEAEKLTRIDDANLRLEDATIKLVPQALLIRLRTALYNTEGAVLSSSDTTTVSSKEFTMTGESMDFDTRTGKGRMVGKTRMIIHNVDSMGGQKQPTEGDATTNKPLTDTREKTKK
jgi:hypothetical protein